MSSGPAPAPERSRPANPAPRWLRALDGAAGLLSAGVLVLGVVLLVAQLAAPILWDGAELGSATGPGWASVAAHVGVGAVGELIVLLRRGWPVPVRAAADLTVVAAALAVMVLLWWP